MNAGLARQWLDRATEDLAVAQLVRNERHASHACFLAQQRIEKALKAYLLSRTNAYPRAHRLVDLLAECEKLQREFTQFRDVCIVIDQCYIPTRYPNGIPGSLAAGLPVDQEAAEAIDAADRISNFVARELE
jgi:HEPN domain-containing protein